MNHYQASGESDPWTNGAAGSSGNLSFIRIKVERPHGTYAELESPFSSHSSRRTD